MEQGGHARAVFVDETGRRHRLVARTAWVLAGLGVAYVVMVVVSLLLPPSLSRLTVPGLGPVLPGPGAAPLGQAEGEQDAPDVLLERSPSPRTSPTQVRRDPAPRLTRSPLPTPRPTTAPTTAPTAAPATTAPAPAPTSGRPTTSTPGRPTTAASPRPRQSEPPGQASRSPRPRPSPSRGPR